TLHPTGISLAEYAKSTAIITPPQCPSSTAGGWSVDPSAPLPTLGQTYSATATSRTSATARQTATAIATASATSSAAAATPTKENGGRAVGVDMSMLGLVGAVAWWL